MLALVAGNIRNLLHYITHFIISLKLSILSIFISLFTIASLIFMVMSYQSASHYLMYTANQSMMDATESLNHQFQTEIALAERDANLTASLIKQNILNVNDINSMVTYLYSIAKQFKISQAMYWGDKNGNYISAEYEDDDSITSNYNSQLTTPPTEKTITRNKNGDILKETTTISNYDPRHRPWYQLAVKDKNAVWTDTYLYQPSNLPGITYAIPIYDNNNIIRGVLGLDVRLDWLSWYIDTQKITPHAVLFIVREDGKLIAYPHFETEKRTELTDIHTITSHWVAKAFDLHKSNQLDYFTFRHNDINYLATFKTIPMRKNQAWNVGLVIPEDDFIGQLNTFRTTSIIINLIIMISGILIVSSLVNNIVRPVKRLIKETNKIKNFNLDEPIKIKTRVKEILLLSDAIDSMKKGLKAFKRYIPSELVKQLILSGEDAKIGGEKKNIVAFFTDIKDFTTISQMTDANDLVLQLNEYFEALTSIIKEEHGTVDKYIGDAVMAFWGAPFETPQPCHHAANAALKIISHLNQLNKKWISEGKQPFQTRIGIHYGEAIVGNIGSSERINYTAVGDSINLASRLEGKNKDFNTSILVSDSVYEAIKEDFDLKRIGLATVKGLSEAVCVYALVGNLFSINRLCDNHCTYN